MISELFSKPSIKTKRVEDDAGVHKVLPAGPDRRQTVHLVEEDDAGLRLLSLKDLLSGGRKLGNWTPRVA